MKKLGKVLSIVLAFCMLASLTALAAPANDVLLSAPAGDGNAILGIETYGFVDTDGAKVAEIVVHYNVDLTGAEIDTSYYAVTNRGTDATNVEVGNAETAGQIKSVSVDGSDVHIYVNTDYQLGNVAKYHQAMYASVEQVKDIVVGDVTIPATEEAVKNYTESTGGQGGGQGGQGGGQGGNAGGGPGGGPGGNAGGGGGMMGGMGGGSSKTVDPGTYHIAGAEDFLLFGDVANSPFGRVDGPAFHAVHCWEEATGEYVDVDLPYALYVPADYNAGKEYALVLQIEDAGSLSDDPMIGITESQGAVNFASEAAQKLVQDVHGLAGVIVVVPEINNSLRSTRDNYSTSAAVPATWQLLDSLTEKYNISENHIYGTGQSMGGMQVVAMAAQRDNYFAAVWANGCQWGNNYNLDAPYSDRGNEAVYYEAPADGTIIWTEDADGNPVNYRNWYYLVSDDNMLLTNCEGDKFSSTVWKELKWLYNDLAGAEIPHVSWNPLDTSVDQEAIANSILKQNNDFGFYWTSFSGGSHMATWIYSHGVWAHTEWLLSQDRATELARAKLDLDKPFELADEQIQTADRAYDGGYFLTGKAGAGTADYNSGLFNMNGQAAEGREPGWPHAESADVPATGDTSMVWVWVAVAALSGAALAGVTAFGRKREEG